MEPVDSTIPENIYTEAKTEEAPPVPAETHLPVVTPFIIYPNPVSSGSTVKLSLPGKNEGTYDLLVFNSAGQLIQVASLISSANKTAMEFRMKPYPRGTYFFQLTCRTTGERKTAKLLVQ